MLEIRGDRPDALDEVLDKTGAGRRLASQC